MILAFTLAGVWNTLQEAQANEEQEANSLVDAPASPASYRMRMQNPSRTSVGDMPRT